MDAIRAPIFTKLKIAESTAACDGGSISFDKKFPDPCSTPKNTSERRVWSNAHRFISGSPCSGSLENVSLEISWMNGEKKEDSVLVHRI